MGTFFISRRWTLLLLAHFSGCTLPLVAGIGSCTYCELDKDTGKRMDGWRSDVFSKVFLYLFIYIIHTYT